jgi:excisionase family DNA binding protein
MLQTMTRRRTAYLTTEQLADKLHVSTQTIRLWIEKRLLPAPGCR